MSRTPDHITDRILDLLADRALGELQGEDAAELDRLLREHPGFNADTMDFAAAAAAKLPVRCRLAASCRS